MVKKVLIFKKSIIFFVKKLHILNKSTIFVSRKGDNYGTDKKISYWLLRQWLGRVGNQHRQEGSKLWNESF